MSNHDPISIFTRPRRRFGAQRFILYPTTLEVWDGAVSRKPKVYELRRLSGQQFRRQTRLRPEMSLVVLLEVIVLAWAAWMVYRDPRNDRLLSWGGIQLLIGFGMFALTIVGMIFMACRNQYRRWTFHGRPPLILLAPAKDAEAFQVFVDAITRQIASTRDAHKRDGSGRMKQGRI